MKNYEEMYIELCKEFIMDLFEEKCTPPECGVPCGGIEVNYFWREAEKSGLWILETYGTAMSKALEELTVVETVNDEDGDFLYNIFRLKKYV